MGVLLISTARSQLCLQSIIIVYLFFAGMQLPVADEIKLIGMLHSLCEAASRDGELLGYLKSDNEIGVESWDGAYSLANLLLEYSLRNDIAIAETARYSFIMLIQLAPRYPALEQSLSQETGLGLTVSKFVTSV